MVPPLYNLQEQGRSILSILGEDLQQVSVIIIVYKNVESLQRVYALRYLHLALLEALTDQLVVF